MKLLAAIVLTSGIISSIASAQSINCQGLTDNNQRLISIHGETYIGSQITITEQKSMGPNLPAFRTVNQMPFTISDIQQTETGVALIGTATNRYFTGATSVEMKLFVPADMNTAGKLSTHVEFPQEKSKEMSVKCSFEDDGGLSLKRGDMVTPMDAKIGRLAPPRPVTLEE